MSPIPDIINSKIVTEQWEAFWADSAELLKRLSPRPVLVATLPLEKDSPEEIQLNKILQACNLTPSDYNIIQFREDTQLAWHMIRDVLQVKTIILFGVTPDQLGVSVQLMPYQVSRFNDCNWIPSGPVSQFMENKDIKQHLWAYGLKPVFVDKVYG